MAQQGFFDANRNRAFPFQDGTTARPIAGPLTLAQLADAVVVDCGFLVGPQTGFDPAAHRVVLRRIRRSGPTFFFDFAADCPGLLGVDLTFTRDLGTPRYATEWADSGPIWGSASITGSASAEQAAWDAGTHCGEPLWSGYLVTGDLDPLDLFLAGDGGVGRGDGAVVEPALVQSLVGSRVTALAVVNADRTRVAAADPDCADPVWPHATGLNYINATCLRGEIRFRAGYNAVVRQVTADGSLVLGAAVGAGAGTPCGDVPLFPGETPPPGSALLDGSQRCNEVLRSINGIGGPLLQVSAGAGIQITADPDTNALTIDVSMAGMAACYDTIAISESLSFSGGA